MTKDIIKKMWVTEKTSALQAKAKYVFMVEPSATKNEIKQAVHARYRVDVVDVTTTRRKAKHKRFRPSITTSPLHKKAVVTLKEGQKIDIQ